MPKITNEDSIFQAAMQALLEYGYTGATTKRIAQMAGVSEVTIFRKYGSKAGLVRAAFQTLTDRVDFNVAVVYSGDVAADLTRMAGTYQSLTDHYGSFMAVLLTEVPRYPELVELLDRPLGFLSSMASLVARYQSEGVMRQENPLHAVVALLGPLVFNVMMRRSVKQIDLSPPDLQAHVSGFLSGRCQVMNAS